MHTPWTWFRKRLPVRPRVLSHRFPVEPLEPRIVLAVFNVSGVIANGTVWANGDIQRITGDATLPAGATLTIQPGAIIQFNPFAGLDLTFEGTVAQSAGTGKVLFTTVRDDTGFDGVAGGGDDVDTEGNGATTGAAGDWGQIRFASTSTAVLSNVDVRFGGGNVTGEVVIESTNVTLSNSVIRNSSANGVRIIASNPTLASDSFLNNAGSAVSMDLASNPAITSATTTNNAINGLTLDAGTLTASRFWDDPSIVYRIAGDVIVAAGATLTIGAGQVVKVRPFGGDDLLVNGTLVADGTPTAPIIFTSDRDDTIGGDTNNNGATTGAHGDWHTITFAAGSTANVMDNVQVRFAGGNSAAAVVLDSAALSLTNSLIRASATNGLRVTGSDPVLTANAFQDNLLSAISMDLTSNPAVTTVTLTNNIINGLTLDGGTLSGSRFWDDLDIVYRLTDDVTIAAGATLTIAAGQVVKVRAFAGVDLLVNGTLLADGTPAAPIIFTTDRDDTIGGDTDNNGPTTGAHGDWHTISLGSSSIGNVLDNVQVRFAGGNSAAAIILNPGAGLSLTSSLIRASASNGLRIIASDPTLTANTFQDNLFSAVSMDLTSNPAITGVTLTNNTINGVTLDAGTLTGSRFWDDPDIVYRLAGDVTVDVGATLTIAPGQIVKVRPFGGDDLFVNGTLLADGTAAAPIIFTTDRDDTIGGDTNNNNSSTGAHGDWHTITFGANSTGNVMDNVQVRFAGGNSAAAIISNAGTELSLTNSLIRASASNGVRIIASNPTLTANVFQDNLASAISMDLVSNPAITGVTLINNGINGLTLDSGTLNGSRVWDDSDIVYRIAGDVIVDAGATLTIGAGQIVKVRPFGGDDLIINGTLLADGTPAAPIVFTTDRDDTIGGDTNNNGATTGGNGDWQTITFGVNSAASVMDNVQVRFAGGNSAAAVVLNSVATVTNSVIRNSSSAGIRIVASNPTLTGLTLQNNSFGAMSMDLVSNPAISSVTLSGNGANALVLDAGAITGSGVWNDPDIVYRLSGDVTVNAGATLTIVPGQIVKARAFAGDDLIVNGTLLATGTSARAIIFTSDRDDSAGGDTNNDGPTNGNNGDWNSIQFGASSTGSVLDSVEVRFAGANSAGAVVVTDSDATVRNSIIRRSFTHGLVARTNATLIAQNNVIFSNTDAGIRAESGAQLTAFNNTIDGNFRGLSADGAATAVTITNNLITNHSRSGIFVNAAGTITISFNDLFNPAASNGNYEGLSDQTGIGGNTLSDPRYVNRTAFDFGLLLGSGAIDAATSVGAPSTDFLGNPRFDDPGIANLGGGSMPFFDIGAIERQAVSDPLNLVLENPILNVAEASVGDPITLSWTVRNNQSLNAEGSWTDAVFISSDAQWDIDDRLVATVLHSSGLAAGASYQVETTVNPQPDLLGSSFLIVRTDYGQVLREVDENDNQGAATVNLTVPTLTFGGSVTINLNRERPARFFQLDVPPGQAANVDALLILNDVDNVGTNELLVSRGQLPTRQDSEYRAASAGADQRTQIFVGGPDTFYIQVFGANLPAGDSAMTLSASLVSFGIDQTSPTRGGNSGMATVTIDGAHFTKDSIARVVAADNSTRTATSVFAESNSRIYATFDLRGLTAGDYRLEVENTTYQQTNLGEFPVRTETVAAVTPFTVEAGGAPDLDFELLAPTALRAGRRYEVTLTYTNQGNVDAPAPLIVVSAEGVNATFQLPEDAYALPGPLQLLGISTTGPAGILRPGQTESVRIIGMAPTTVGQDFPFAVSLATDDGTALSFNGYLASLGVDPNSAPWNSVAAELRQRFGPTWTEYAAELASQATVASRDGTYNHSVRSLVLGAVNSALAAAAGEPAPFAEAPAPDHEHSSDEDHFEHAHLEPRIGPQSVEPTPPVAADEIGNAPPTAFSFAVDVINDSPVVLFADDVETPDAELIFNVLTQPKHGRLSGTAPNLTYVANASFRGPDTFTYTVTDTGTPARTSSVATVTLNVMPDCDPAKLREYISELTGLGGISDQFRFAAGSEPAQALEQFVSGTGGTLHFGPDSRIADDIVNNKAGSLRSFHNINDAAQEKARQFITEQLKTGATSVGNFNLEGVPNVSFYGANESLGGFSDVIALSAFNTSDLRLQVLFGGTQGLTVGAKNIQVRITERPDGAKIAFYRATLEYHIMDRYEFDKSDATLGGPDWYGRELALCGQAKTVLTSATVNTTLLGVVTLAGQTPDLPPTPPRGDPRIVKNIRVVGSFDPNDKVGLEGAGASNHIVNDATIPYTVFFENDPMKATAPAQRVTIEDQLDPELDWSTFELGTFEFGNVSVSAPPGLREYSTHVDTTNLDGSPLRVNLSGEINLNTGLVTWVFDSIDPLTGAPPNDPEAGFLPVNDPRHRGEGRVSYTVRPDVGSPTGTTINNLANIFFDENPPIVTPTTLHTLDADAPSSSVNALPVTTNSLTVPLAWSGSDDAGGSGIATYDVFVSDNGGPFTLLLDDTVLTSSAFTGQDGHTYGFFTVATDNLGFVEPSPTLPDTTTTVQAATLAIEASDSTATEVKRGKPADPAVFALTRTGDLSSPLTVPYTLSGTAAGGTDFTTLSGSAVFAAGSATATVQVDPLDDRTKEGGESLVLTLQPVAGLEITGSASATVTIADNDVATVTVSASDAIAAETAARTKKDPGKFTFTRAGSTAKALVVDFTIAGTASDGEDFQELNGKVKFAPGSKKASVKITPNDDTILEGDETVAITLAPSSKYNLGTTSTATVTIGDNETAAIAARTALKQIGSGNQHSSGSGSIWDCDRNALAGLSKDRRLDQIILDVASVVAGKTDPIHFERTPPFRDQAFPA